MAKFQFWRNGVMMGLVSEQEAEEIMANARKAGRTVMDAGHYFEIGDKN